MAKEFLKNLFESKQDYLRNSLQDLQLPKDALKIERAVSEYLNKLFDENGEFRMQLTQSEDYILQSALSLLNAQQAILSEVSMVKRTKGRAKTAYHQQKRYTIQRIKQRGCTLFYWRKCCWWCHRWSGHRNLGSCVRLHCRNSSRSLLCSK